MTDQQPKKQKLTLSVDKEVIERARNLGINISEITEKILRGFTFSPGKVETDLLYEKYKQLFQAMLPLLDKYNASVEVGSEVYDVEGQVVDIFPIKLLADGALWFDYREEKDIRKFPVSDFHEPKQILSNFIIALSASAERQKQRLSELEMARRIIEAITGGLTRSVTASTAPSITRQALDENRQEKILKILQLTKEPAKITHIMYKANMTYYQLRRYLDYLLNIGMLEEISHPRMAFRITKKGLEFLNSPKPSEISSLESYLGKTKEAS